MSNLTSEEGGSAPNDAMTSEANVQRILGVLDRVSIRVAWWARRIFSHGRRGLEETARVRRVAGRVVVQKDHRRMRGGVGCYNGVVDYSIRRVS